MPELRHGRRHLFQIAFLRLAVDAHDTPRLGKGQATQEKVLDQTKDGGVHSDAERESDHGKNGEPGRFAELTESETKIVHGIDDC